MENMSRREKIMFDALECAIPFQGVEDKAVEVLRTVENMVTPPPALEDYRITIGGLRRLLCDFDQGTTIGALRDRLFRTDDQAAEFVPGKQAWKTIIDATNFSKKDPNRP